MITFDPFMRNTISSHGISDDQWDILTHMARSLASWNERINVVSRQEGLSNLVSRHYMPSLALLNLFSPGAALESEDHSRWTVSALKEELRRLGLPVTGRKVELIERIQKAVPAATGGQPSCSSCQTLAGASIMDVGTGGGFPG